MPKHRIVARILPGLVLVTMIIAGSAVADDSVPARSSGLPAHHFTLRHSLVGEPFQLGYDATKPIGQEYVLDRVNRSPFQTGISAASTLFQGPTPYQLSRKQSAIKGADVAGSMGMFLGAWATSFGWIDEESAWWLAGSAAALGALYGGTAGYENEGWSIEMRLGGDER